MKAALEKAIETLSRCKEDLEAADKLYKSLVVTDLTADLAKRVYQAGEKVDTTGLEVRVKHADGSEEVLKAGDYTLKLPEIPEELEGEDLDLTLEVTYLGKTIELNLTIKGTPTGESEEQQAPGEESGQAVPGQAEPGKNQTGGDSGEPAKGQMPQAENLPTEPSATGNGTGTPSAQPAAQQPTQAAAPAMGDESQLGWWMATALLSLMGLAVLNLKKNRGDY